MRLWSICTDVGYGHDILRKCWFDNFKKYDTVWYVYINKYVSMYVCRFVYMHTQYILIGNIFVSLLIILYTHTYNNCAWDIIACNLPMKTQTMINLHVFHFWKIILQELWSSRWTSVCFQRIFIKSLTLIRNNRHERLPCQVDRSLLASNCSFYIQE